MTKTKTYKVGQAAKIGRCHRSTICRLIKSGTLHAENTGPGAGKGYRVTNNADQIRDIVNKYAKRSGYKKKPNGDARSRRSRGASMTGRLDVLGSLLSFNNETRKVLVEIGKKFTPEELQLLKQL